MIHCKLNSEYCDKITDIISSYIHIAPDPEGLKKKLDEALNIMPIFNDVDIPIFDVTSVVSYDTSSRQINVTFLDSENREIFIHRV